MASKLNLGIKEMYEHTKKAGTKVEDAASSLKYDLKEKVVSIQKSKIPFLSKLFTRSGEFLRNHKADLRYLLLIIPVVVSFIIAREIQRQQDFRSKAVVHTASVAFQLQNWTLPPEGNFEIWINSDSPVAFVNANISFNPNLVRLTHEISTAGGLTRIVKVTPMAEANSTGIVSIVLALDPSRIVNPPNGSFQVANLVFNSNTPDPNITTVISFNTGQMQLVAKDQSVFQLTATNLNLVLNPTPTPTPSPSPTPSSSPTPNPNDTIPPVVTITTPADGSIVPTKGSLSIRSTASDESGIANITIAIDGKTNKTCTKTTSCQYNISVNKLTPGSHAITVTAIDKSPNLNTTSTTINVTK